jgi:LuxR family transcriptional regulator, maltose regulon positive regulatory protein
VSFARTKIQPPRPHPTLIARGALQSRLADALTTRRAVSLCAPAGYGKTTLLTQALAQLSPDVAVAWVSADSGDDLQRLLECMTAALEPFDLPWRTAPATLVARLAAGTPDSRHGATSEVINALDACENPHGVLVFDDLGRVDDPEFFRFLDNLIERAGTRWTIVLCSRRELPVSLARLRASGELAEFRQLQLQFAHDEVRQLAQAAGFDTALADRLFTRTHGWPAGLRLAIGAATGGAAAAANTVPLERALQASERPMFDYLVSEVLDQLAPEMAEFLQRVAVLPELDVARCAAVAQDLNAAARLDEIERGGLFVDVLDAPVPTLRLHELFRDALTRALGQRDPAALAAARRIAADTESDPIRRIALLLDAGDVDAAAALVYAHVPSQFARSGTASAAHLLGRFPRAVSERSPELLFVRGLLAWVRWDFPTMLASFERAEAGFSTCSRTDDALLARAFRATGLIPLGRLDEAAQLLQQLRECELPAPAQIMRLHAESWLAVDDGRTHEVAPLIVPMLDLLERVDRLELWYHTTPANRLPALPGMTRPLLRHAQLLLRVCGDEPSTLRALTLLLRAWDALWRGQLLHAGDLMERARDDIAWAGRTGAVWGHLLALTGMRDAALGQTATALSAAETRLRELGAGYSEWGRWQLLMFVARIAAACNDAGALRDALQRLDAQRQLAHPTATLARTRTVVALDAQLAWLEGRVDDAVTGWCNALEHETEIDVWGIAAETRMRLSRALLHRREHTDAARVLVPLFERVEDEDRPGGCVLAPDVVAELAGADWGEALTAPLRDTMQRWSRALAGQRERAGRSRALSSNGAPADPWRGLTGRERDVLARIAAGDSNKLIARALDLSVHTVKRHVANILGKLGVDTRGQAAAWHRDRIG